MQQYNIQKKIHGGKKILARQKPKLMRSCNFKINTQQVKYFQTTILAISSPLFLTAALLKPSSSFGVSGQHFFLGLAADLVSDLLEHFVSMKLALDFPTKTQLWQPSPQAWQDLQAWIQHLALE